METLASVAPVGWTFVDQLLDLPEAMETGDLDVIHFSDVNNRMATTVPAIATLGRYASGQIHSLSYQSVCSRINIFCSKSAPYDGVFVRPWQVVMS